MAPAAAFSRSISARSIAARLTAFRDLAKRRGVSPAQIALAWRLAFACEPTTEQAREAVAFLVHQATVFAAKKPVAGDPDPQFQALANFCQTLLSANQFLYVD